MRILVGDDDGAHIEVLRNNRVLRQVLQHEDDGAVPIGSLGILGGDLQEFDDFAGFEVQRVFPTGVVFRRDLRVGALLPLLRRFQTLSGRQRAEGIAACQLLSVGLGPGEGIAGGHQAPGGRQGFLLRFSVLRKRSFLRLSLRRRIGDGFSLIARLRRRRSRCCPVRLGGDRIAVFIQRNSGNRAHDLTVRRQDIPASAILGQYGAQFILVDRFGFDLLIGIQEQIDHGDAVQDRHGSRLFVTDPGFIVHAEVGGHVDDLERHVRRRIYVSGPLDGDIQLFAALLTDGEGILPDEKVVFPILQRLRHDQLYLFFRVERLIQHVRRIGDALPGKLEQHQDDEKRRKDSDKWFSHGRSLNFVKHCVQCDLRASARGHRVFES